MLSTLKFCKCQNRINYWCSWCISFMVSWYISSFSCAVVQKPKHQVLILQNFLPQGCLTYSCLHSEFQMGSSLASLTSCTFSTNQQKAPSIKVTSKCSLPGPQSSWVRVPGHAKESETGTFGLDGKIKSIFFWQNLFMFPVLYENMDIGYITILFT